jgi:hypothetical protein
MPWRSISLKVARAIEQESGFVLIQGPPGILVILTIGSGKTKTILGIIAASQVGGYQIPVPSSPRLTLP